MCQNSNCLNNELKTLLVAIEDLRKELNSKADQSNVFQDPEVIELSQKLDALLNEFYNLSLIRMRMGLFHIHNKRQESSNRQ